MYCTICGAYTKDKEAIKKAKENNICPICLTVRSLTIKTKFLKKKGKYHI